jgi:hypothetical protein
MFRHECKRLPSTAVNDDKPNRIGRSEFGPNEQKKLKLHFLEGPGQTSAAETFGGRVWPLQSGMAST